MFSTKSYFIFGLCIIGFISCQENNNNGFPTDGNNGNSATGFQGVRPWGGRGGGMGGGGRMGGRWGHHGGAFGGNLTDAQREELKNIFHNENATKQQTQDALQSFVQGIGGDALVSLFKV